MEALVTFITAMIALSVGAERVTEIVKGFSSWLQVAKEPPQGAPERWRRVLLQVIAATAGGVMAFIIGPAHFLPALLSSTPEVHEKVLVAGLLGVVASGGSAFWNHLLDIVGVIKETREKVLADKKAANATLPPMKAPT